MVRRRFVITIPDCPASGNQGGGGARRHWATAHREKVYWQDLYAKEFTLAGIRKRMVFCTIEVTVRWKYRFRRDSTNYFAPIFKPMLDALVSSGFIKDDTDDWIRVEPLKFEVVPRGEWPYKDPRIGAEMTINLEGAYA